MCYNFGSSNMRPLNVTFGFKVAWDSEQQLRAGTMVHGRKENYMEMEYLLPANVK